MVDILFSLSICSPYQILYLVFSITKLELYEFFVTKVNKILENLIRPIIQTF